MPEIVAHPETGKPSIVVTSYQELEINDLNNQVSELETLLADVTAEHEAALAKAEELTAEKARLESELSDSKSLVDGFNALAIEPGTEAGTEGTSSENVATEATDEAVEVPVNVDSPPTFTSF